MHISKGNSELATNKASDIYRFPGKIAILSSIILLDKLFNQPESWSGQMSGGFITILNTVNSRYSGRHTRGRRLVSVIRRVPNSGV